MSDRPSLDLYELLPAFVRLRDEEQGGPLRALLSAINDQADILKRDIDGLWDDMFIETCRDWAIPYIGDLVGSLPLIETPTGRRADVAKTLYYRRRKGTLPIVEEIARDVTGWGAVAVAFFELLNWTQNLNHLRLDPSPDPEGREPEAADRVGTANLRRIDLLDRVGGPFDRLAHTVDVRPIQRAGGWHNLRNVGIFVWRLGSYPAGVAGDEVAGKPPVFVQARRSATHPHGFHFSPLGNPIPLFHHPLAERDEAGLAAEIHVPGPIRPLAFHFDLEATREGGRPGAYYGPDRSVYVVRDGTPVAPAEIHCRDLSAWPRPPAGKVAVDVRHGRLAFAEDEEPERVDVRFHYGFGADLGGGLYDRRRPASEMPAGPSDLIDTLARPEVFGTPIRVPSEGIDRLADAIAAWDPAERPRVVIQIEDNRTYEEDLAIDLDHPGGEATLVVIQAANRMRPVILGDLTVTGGGGISSLVLNGLVVAGRLAVQGRLGHLEIAHSTLVPGRRLGEDGRPVEPAAPSIEVQAPNDRLSLTIDRSIVGPLLVPEDAEGLVVRDSIVDCPAAMQGTDAGAPAIASGAGPIRPGPPTVLERATILGPVAVKELTLASEVIFARPVTVERRQAGCVRFSFVTADLARLPRRYRCQPELALERALEARRRMDGPLATLGDAERDALLARLRPAFASVRYGQPGYAQLAPHAAQEITAGAEDGSEMGVYQHRQQPQRLANLRSRLAETLPFGLVAGILEVT